LAHTTISSEPRTIPDLRSRVSPGRGNARLGETRLRGVVESVAEGAEIMRPIDRDWEPGWGLAYSAGTLPGSLFGIFAGIRVSGYPVVRWRRRPRLLNHRLVRASFTSSAL
jgi:hypothetical protein